MLQPKWINALTIQPCLCSNKPRPTFEPVHSWTSAGQVHDSERCLRDRSSPAGNWQGPAWPRALRCLGGPCGGAGSRRGWTGRTSVVSAAAPHRRSCPGDQNRHHTGELWPHTENSAWITPDSHTQVNFDLIHRTVHESQRSILRRYSNRCHEHQFVMLA